MVNQTRGVRNNNPGNLIKNDSDKWQGLADVQDDPKFFKFKDPVYGIRALARTLLAYQDRNDLHTINQFITRWAPAVENNTQAYIDAAVEHCDVPGGQTVDLHKYAILRCMVEAIIEHENGDVWSKLYSNAQVTKALVLAGVEPEKRSLMVSPQVIGSAVAATATAAQPVVATVQAQLQPLTDYSDWIKHIFVAVALLGVLVAIVAKVDERRKGIS